MKLGVLWMMILVVFIYVFVVFYLSKSIDAFKKAVLYNVDPDNLSARVIRVFNEFPHDISIYFEENDQSGTFLTNIGPNETLQLSTTNGNIIYATDPNGFERLSVVSVLPHVNDYSFTPLLKDSEDYELLPNEEYEHTSLKNDSSDDLIMTDSAGRVLDYTLNIEHRSRPHPLVKRLRPHELASTALSAKFRSLSGRKINLWYDDGREGTIQAHLGPGQETTTNTYVGHEFYATYGASDEDEVSRFTISDDKVLYVINDPNHPADEEIMEQSRREENYLAEYFNRTGLHWRHYFGDDGPRPPPASFMWPGKVVGDVHEVVTTAGYWTCSGNDKCGPSPNNISLELEVISTTPRAFVIMNFFNDAEIEEIKRTAKPRLHLSQVGDAAAGIFESKTRTSKNAWVGRKSSPILENLYARASHLLRIPQPTLNQNVEDLQVVYYTPGQKYDAHHDWGASGYPESRFLTLLLYMNDPIDENSGGHTSFPKDGKGSGIKVHAGKGNAVLFYNLLEDGNGDDLALHAAMPVIRGEKWLCNFWVWDPSKDHAS